MKEIFTGIAVLIHLAGFSQISLGDTTDLTPVEIRAVRATPATPIAQTTLKRAEIQKLNTGQDLPFVLQSLPSVVIHSDAGNGVGYTGIRIRGTDASRINVTLNGIPYNDAESQGTFFVDIPDFSSSAGSIQVQRGLGTTAIGTGSFGGNINISTNEIIKEQTLSIFNTAGSYGTLRNSVLFNSGIIKKHFLTDLRFSHISSDGYIDRAFSKLLALHGSVAYISNKESIRFNIINGREKSYQAWNGIDEETLHTNRQYNSSGTEKPGDPYKNEIDKYNQTHYQFFYNRNITSSNKFSSAIFLTRGKGYYEQYKANQKLANYDLPDYYNGSTYITKTDLIRRLNLNNYYYGALFSFHFQLPTRNIITGAGYTLYDGRHFGEVVRTITYADVPENYKWYNNTAYKRELSLFTKWQERIANRWYSFVDVQLRAPQYIIHGFRYNPEINQQHHWFFINPKVGVTYMRNRYKAYLSFGGATKEPNRDDFEAGEAGIPKPEQLYDIELGYEQKWNKVSASLNAFYMYYHNQLVLTGKINDVGAYTRTNISRSFRMGLEWEAVVQLTQKISLTANLTLSKNRIPVFTEFIDDYDNGGQQERLHTNTPIAYSPGSTGFWNITWLPIKRAQFSLSGKYVGRQYLDNTGNKARSIRSFYLQDARLSYTFHTRKRGLVETFVNLNNIFGKLYEANGYTFSYLYGGTITTENYFFPMAPFNFLAGINIKL